MEESSLRRIEKFKESIKKLKEISKAEFEDFLERYYEDVAERNLQVCVEAIMDVSRKIISFKDWKIPKTYKEIVSVLKENKVLMNSELARSLEDLIGVRNLIVHLYAEVKAEIIYENLKGYIKMLEKCIKVLLEYCKENKIDP